MKNQEVLFEILRKTTLVHPILLEISIIDSNLIIRFNSKIVDLEELSKRYMNFILINNYDNFLEFLKKIT